jgi:adenylate cyclase class IV
MYEVEYKVEITDTERDTLYALFEKEGFAKKPPVVQNDYYIEAVESPFGGFDLKRYRDEGDKIFYTEKVWEDVDGKKVRREAEREVTREEFDSKIAEYPSALKIQKDRQAFTGEYEGCKIHIDMDSVKFDHSPSVRYFIEAETMTESKEEVGARKDLMLRFLRESLGRSDIKEASGMFTMAFKKQ